MNSADNPLLSILVVSHNQERVLPRCLDSIFAQRISVPYEVIVSDDASTDGTPEIIKAYAQKHPNLRYCTINSDDYAPTIPSERSGINKANAYSYARGRYVVNIDGDDYLISDDIYELQLQRLEANPDCAMCMQNMTRINDGDPSGETWIWKCYGFNDGDKFTFEDFERRQQYISNPAFMMRRDEELKPIERYGIMFNDEFITFHHMQMGKVIYLDRSDYMYVHYHGSIDSSYLGYDRMAKYSLLPLIYIYVFPRCETAFLIGYRQKLIEALKGMVARGTDRYTISDQMRAYLKRFDGFLFRYLYDDSLRMKWYARLRVRLTLYYSLLLSKLHVYDSRPLHLLYKMMV